MKDIITYLTKDVHKVLLIGTGGGNDIVSCLLPALFMKNKEIHIMGMLSPASVHLYNGENEKPINKIKSNRVLKRFIKRQNDMVEISFIDLMLPAIAQPFKDFYHLSLRPNMLTAVRELEGFINTNKYDLVLAVDVGGDILADVSKDKHILSPLMDLSILKILSKIKTKAKIYLLEFGFGTDGEIKEERRMIDLLDELHSNDLVIKTGKIPVNAPEVKRFEEIYNEIRRVREGNTLREFFVGLKEGETKHYFQHSYKIGDFNYPYSFSYTIPKSLLDKVFLINLKGLANHREKQLKNYTNLLELLIRYKYNNSWSSEMDLQYLWDNKHCIYILDVNCEDKNAEERILREGLKYFIRNEHANFCLMKNAKVQPVFDKIKDKTSAIKDEEFAVFYKEGYSEQGKCLLKKIQQYYP